MTAPTAVPHRNLRCTTCNRLWQLIEPQGAVLHPNQFVCPDCAVPVDGQWTRGRPVPYNVVPF